MNFIFADAGKSYLNMVQQDIPREFGSNIDHNSSQDQVFSERLSKTIEKIERREHGSFLHIKSGRSDQVQDGPVLAREDSIDTIDNVSEKMDQEDGLAFILALKNILLMVSKGDLNNISIDSDGLEALKKMLVNAGFKETDIMDLLAELSEKSNQKELSLDELFDKFFELSYEAESDTDLPAEAFLEMSALPFIESILNSLGIPKEKISGILAEADRGDKGISLDAVIENLQAVQKNAFYAHDQYQTPEGGDSFKMMLSQLGIDQAESGASSLTLNDFVKALEKLYREISLQQDTADVQTDNAAKSGAPEKSSDLISELFNGLAMKNQNTETPAFEFSYEQIRDQFKTQLLAVDSEKTPNKALFSIQKDKGKTAVDATLKTVFKEMEALVGGKKNGMSEPADKATQTREFLKQIKSKTLKSADQTQMSNVETKSNTVESGLSGLKTKSSFKNLPTYVTHQVSKSLVRAINQGESTLRIQLKPPELGRIMMTIDHTGNSMKVSIMTEHSAAKEILAANLTDLKAVLSNSGVTLEQFEVDMNSNFRQSMADARNQAGNFRKKGPNLEKIDQINGEGIHTPQSLLDTINQGATLHFVA